MIRLTGPAITARGRDRDRPRPAAGAPGSAEARRPSPPRFRHPSRRRRAAEELYARLAATPLTPPAVGAGDERPLAHLVAAGRAVRAGRDLAFTAEAVAVAQQAVVELAGESGRITLAQLRDRLGISRKFAQGLLEALDARGVTRRVGDERILRRRAPTSPETPVPGANVSPPRPVEPSGRTYAAGLATLKGAGHGNRLLIRPRRHRVDPR